MNDTILQQFMMHAPHEPQKWFTPKMPIQRPIMPAAFKWCAGCKDGLDCEHNADCEKITIVQNGVRLWDEGYAKALYIQWPVAWAKAVLAATRAAIAKAEGNHD